MLDGKEVLVAAGMDILVHIFFESGRPNCDQLTPEVTRAIETSQVKFI